MRFLLLSSILLLLNSFTVQAQEDSLKSIWNDLNQDAATRERAMYKLIQYASMSGSDSTIDYLDEYLSYGESLDNLEILGKGQMAKGIYYYLNGQTEDALLAMNEAYKLYIRNNNVKYAGIVLLNTGSVYHYLNDYSTALDFFINATHIFDSVGYLPGKVTALQNLGIIHVDVKRYQKALVYLYQAKDLADSLDLRYDLALSLHNIGQAKRAINANRQAIEAYEKSIEIAKSEAIVLLQEVNYIELGAMYSQLDSARLSLENFSKALDLIDKSTNPKNQANLYIELGHEIAKTNRDSAINLGNKAYKISDQHDLVAEKVAASLLRYEVYKSGNDLEATLNALEKYIALKSEEKTTSQEQKALEKTYHFEMEDSIFTEHLRHLETLKSIQRKSSNEKYIITVSLSIFLLLIGGLAIFLIRNHKKEKCSLLTQIESLSHHKEMSNTVFTDSNASSLIKSKIENAYGIFLNNTDWSILEELMQDPFISNKSLADKVNRSTEGVSSSLRKMYTQLKIESRSNKKLCLLKEALKASS